jgi:hypothetical protein
MDSSPIFAGFPTLGHGNPSDKARSFSQRARWQVGQSQLAIGSGCSAHLRFAGTPALSFGYLPALSLLMPTIFDFDHLASLYSQATLSRYPA